MNLSRPFILRPVATVLLMLALCIAGLMAWRLLPVAALPQVDFPVIQVFTFQPGASPDVTARTITAPLERRLGQIPSLRQMSSTSSSGASVITLQFVLDANLAVAEQNVQSALNTAATLLPADLPAPPIYRKVNPADAPILTLAIENMVVNLADPGGDRFAQIGITLELADAKTETLVKQYLPSIRSGILMLVSQRTAEELLGREGKEKLAQDIRREVSKPLGFTVPKPRKARAPNPDDEEEGEAPRPRADTNPVRQVLFSSFIIQ